MYLRKFYMPDDLVVDRNFSVRIIDSDVAMQVDEDEAVDGQCGMKPEIPRSRRS